MSDKDTTPDLMDIAENLDDLSNEQLQQLMEESRIVIKPGGEVVIENLTSDMLDVAYELDPENPGIQCRVDAQADAQTESAPEPATQPASEGDEPSAASS